MNLKYFIWIFCFTFEIFWTSNNVKAEVYSAISDVEKLLQTERDLPSFINLYLQNERERLNQVEMLAKRYVNSKFSDVRDNEMFVSSPLNVYHLIKRLTIDFNEIFALMNTTKLDDVIMEHLMDGKFFEFPDPEDFTAAAISLNLLLNTYNLNLTELIKGNIHSEVESVKELSADDCFRIGLKLYLKKEFHQATTWFEAALNMGKDKKSQILEYLSKSLHALKNYTGSFIFIRELLKIEPENQYAKNKMVDYNDQVIKVNDYSFKPIQNASLFEKLCRNEYKQENKSSFKLKCYYTYNESPFLIIQPVKVEEAHLQPKIVVFHDVVNDYEINVIKTLSIPELSRSRVGQKRIVENRISKIAWLSDDHHSAIKGISLRFEELTGLVVSGAAERLQVNNYGIGGYYVPHFDFTLRKRQEYSYVHWGNRLATILLYMNNVKAGGATVFTKLGIAIQPKKGSAVFWYNLERTGKGDQLTKHAGCPVLAGIKWIANKWIHEHPQMFRKPCGKTQMDIYHT